MTYTQNHHLPQWVKSDRIMMDDFNAAMVNIESGITTAQSAAASAQSTANSAKSAAATAQSAANAAQTAANRAQATADALPYVTGSYTGTGTRMSITLGFKPRFMIISGVWETVGGGSTGYFGDAACITDGHSVKRHLVFTETGFTVDNDPDGTGGNPRLNNKNRIYDYIAFK